jgi:predicted  nucleic acid-binding Zn-ribbon protein
MKHEMPEFEIPTMNLDSIAHHRDEANLKATSKRVIHGQPEFQDKEKSEKVITNKTAVTGKSKPDNYRDTVDWVESQQNIRATTNERSQLNSNSDSVEKEIRQLEEEIKTIRAARQAVSDLQMPIMTNRRTNVSLRDHDMTEQSSQPRREAESNLELWREL